MRLGVARHARVAARGAAARTYVAPVREMKFLLHEVHGFAPHYATLSARVTPCDAETLDAVVDASAALCEEVLAPLRAPADAEGCARVDAHTVTTPTGYKDAYVQYVDAGWQGLSFPVEFGGQGLPPSLALVQADMAATANFTWLMFPGLSKGAINTIQMHGDRALQAAWLPRLVSGEWTGTMCLTEPQCGSDLGQVSTRATPRGDGSYRIDGTKIFISCGDHDLTENIVHCVLARLPGAPAGTKGISLFLVPKRLVDGGPGGPVGARNGVATGRIENKMGCHGSPTCELEFDDATGWLIGEENRGLAHMFTFINTSRVGTALQGVAAAELALQNSLPYALERRSMRALGGAREPARPADAIVHHAAVRAMLLTQKAIAEGGRSMAYECALVADRFSDATLGGDAAAARVEDERLAFLTPILKGFLTEAGKEAADLGIQVWGGHGYVRENGAEQTYRDVRIAPVWEGTTQIQALDLLGRKVLLQKLRPVFEHVAGLLSLCSPHLLSPDAALRAHAWALAAHAADWAYLTARVAARAARDRDEVSAASVDFLMYSGWVTLAAHWLRIEVAAARALAAPAAGAAAAREPAAFYEAKRHTAAFVFARLLPRTRAHRAAMLAPLGAVMGLPPTDFSFDYAR